MLGVNNPIKMAIMPPETSASSSSVSSRDASRTCSLFRFNASLMIRSLSVRPDGAFRTGVSELPRPGFGV
jgi:hypothetical protein